jgi:hypothetical protein
MWDAGIPQTVSESSAIAWIMPPKLLLCRVFQPATAVV